MEAWWRVQMKLGSLVMDFRVDRWIAWDGYSYIGCMRRAFLGLANYFNFYNFVLYVCALVFLLNSALRLAISPFWEPSFLGIFLYFDVCIHLLVGGIPNQLLTDRIWSRKERDRKKWLIWIVDISNANWLQVWIPR